MAIAKRNNQENSKPKLKNCVICGKIFASVWGNNTCNACRARIADKEREVVEYVMDHMNETIPSVAEHCGVSVRFVRKMIESGKLTVKGENMSYPCSSCGKPIVVGQYCAECLAKIQTQIDKAKEVMKKHWQDESINTNKTAERMRSKRESRIGSDSIKKTKNSSSRDNVQSSSTYKTMKDSSSKSSKKSSRSAKNTMRLGKKITMPTIESNPVRGMTILEKIADSSTSVFSKIISGSKNQSDVK